MKRLIPFFLAFLMLLSLCGCRGSFGSIDLQDAIEIPEDGIVKKSTIEQIKDKNDNFFSLRIALSTDFTQLSTVRTIKNNRQAEIMALDENNGKGKEAEK